MNSNRNVSKTSKENIDKLYFKVLEKVKKISLNRLAPISSYSGNTYKRLRESEKPSILRKKPLNKSKRQKTGSGKRKKHTKKRKYTKKINS